MEAVYGIFKKHGGIDTFVVSEGIFPDFNSALKRVIEINQGYWVQIIKYNG